MPHRYFTLYLAILSALLIFTTVLGIAMGSTDIPWSIVTRVLINKLLSTEWVNLVNIDESQQIIIWLLRTPRVIIAALVGIALAIAGVQMQGLFQNPLASPDIIGTSAGGALGAVLALATGLANQSLWYLPLLAVGGAFTTLLMLYGLTVRQGNLSVTTLLLAGVALNAFIGALTTALITWSWLEYEATRTMIFWLLGGLDSRTWSHVWIALPGVTIATIIAWWYARDLDLLLLGEETAYSLGVAVEPVKLLLLFNTALLTGIAVAMSGVIGFVGLIIPHIIRLLVGPTHRYLIPLAALFGANFMITIDLLARTLHPPQEIRLGILTALLGSPFFLFLLLRQTRVRTHLTHR